MRRLSEPEYRHTVADIFGAEIEVRGRFEPDVREHGLNAIGTAELTITPSGFQQYFAIASSVMEQVLDPTRAPAALGCGPDEGAVFDAACTSAVLERYGSQLFRRPLGEAELATYLSLAADGATAFEDFSYGLRLALSNMLAAPDFLFRIERTERVPGDTAALRLDGYSKATRLSYLLWNTTPDVELFAAAQSGVLHTEAGLREQLARLIESPRLVQGVRALFNDVLQFDQFANVSKDATLYPKFSQLVASSAQEETLLTVVDHLLDQDGDYRELLDNEQIDIAIIATPDHWHALQTIAALHAGAHVFVEKPTGHTIGESRAMVSAARQADRVVEVGLHRRVVRRGGATGIVRGNAAGA